MFEYPGGGFDEAAQLMSKIPIASNISYGTNPPYSSMDFLSLFPQFAVVCSDGTVPAMLLSTFISMANATVSYSKYFELWSYCMGLYVAHFLTLFLSASRNSTTVPGLIAASAPKLPTASKSALGVSVSYDTSAVFDSLKGFGTWLTTSYGVEFATFANMAGMGGMVI